MAAHDDLRGGARRYDLDAAADWCDTDPASVRADIARLGAREAARYQVELARSTGDERWRDVTVRALRDVWRGRGWLSA